MRKNSHRIEADRSQDAIVMHESSASFARRIAKVADLDQIQYQLSSLLLFDHNLCGGGFDARRERRGQSRPGDCGTGRKLS